jgi:anti-anti-sigma factor
LVREEPERFFARRRVSDGRVVVELGAECDTSTLAELNELLREVVAAQPREVVVDLARASFVDSLTLGSLSAAAKRVRTRGGALRVVRAVAPEVRRAFEITGLDTYVLASAWS